MEDWGLTIKTRTVRGWEADPDRGLGIKIGGCMAEGPTRSLRTGGLLQTHTQNTTGGWEADPGRGLPAKIGGWMAERPTTRLR